MLDQFIAGFSENFSAIFAILPSAYQLGKLASGIVAILFFLVFFVSLIATVSWVFRDKEGKTPNVTDEENQQLLLAWNAYRQQSDLPEEEKNMSSHQFEGGWAAARRFFVQTTT